MKSKIKKQMEKNRNEIIMTLPGFINQLLLFMHSGAILTDAFCKIAASYGKLDAKRQNYFTEQIYNIYVASQRNGENVIASFCKFARTSNVKELARVAAIMSENLNRKRPVGKTRRTKRELMGRTKTHSTEQNQAFGKQDELSARHFAYGAYHDNGSTGNATNIKYKEVKR